jgi:hypothetical protein
MQRFEYLIRLNKKTEKNEIENLTINHLYRMFTPSGT